MRVLLRAPLLTNSGYGVHSRQIFEWLVEKNIDLTVECLKWGNTPWMLDETKSPLIKKIMDRSKTLEKPYDVTFQLQLPDEWDPSLGKYNVGLSAVVETEKCNPEWVEKCNQMDHIVVPSTFTKNVVKRSGVLMKKIDVIPEWFNENILEFPEKKTEIEKVSTDFNYLIISTLTALHPELDRKNLLNTLKWLFEKHKDDKDIGIVLKTSLGRGSKKDKIDTEKYLENLVLNLRKSPYPKLYLLHGNMTDKEISELYNNEKIKCLVSATRGEGYGLPIVDAAASGMPVIATGWSGHLEFLSKYNYLPIDYDIKEIPSEKIDNRIFLEGFRWADPKKESFFECIDNLHDHYETIKENCAEDSKTIKKMFCKQNIKNSYDEIFGGLF